MQTTSVRKATPALTCLLVWLSAASPLTGQDDQSTGLSTAESSYSPVVGHDFPTNLYWGDTHLHTNLSNDAFAMGNQVLSPDEAYRFAKGEPITSHSGRVAKIRKPLDFLVVSDHAINMGVMVRLLKRDPLLLDTELGKKWAKLFGSMHVDTHRVLNGSFEGFKDRFNLVFHNRGEERWYWDYFERDKMTDPEFRSSVWEETIANAERHNDPGKFTAFIGFEWTQVQGLHRVVIFQDGAERVRSILPISRLDTNDPEDLWAYLGEYTSKTGGDVLAIPHNSNISGGKMFATKTIDGDEFTTDYAKRRAFWEPINEVTQIKGDGEAYPYLSPDDEFADYETWHSWSGPTLRGITIDKDWLQRKKSDYARYQLQLGLEQQARLGVNPFKFGMIGSTDAHTSFSSVDEGNFWGKQSLSEPGLYRNFLFNHYAASGYAAVWAHENTRDSIFAALRRRETYATTGPRMSVRFFGGWDYQPDDATSPNLAQIGYSGGVPMGGDLTSAPSGMSPRFLIRAVKDPDGANLDRVQVIKVWRTENGELKERVHDVAVSDGREIPVDGSKVEPVGSTVDLSGGRPTYNNSIGAPELAAVWLDPDFDPRELAVYYVRVIEIPTPRWIAYDRAFFELRDRTTGELEQVTQERAYTSPIWYTP